ncbi:MAG TPA: NAD(P)-dependent oxidoreductase [Acidimicrobiia bacterium]|nr:NAD(P)-dependent oxidoreductase [Acidimicrobiia bacterium]
MTGRVLITGASGFIGRTLAGRYRNEGWEVRGVDLRADPAAGVVAGDIGTPGTWQRAALGCETVLHTAALVSNTPTLDDAWRINVCGTHHVIDAARDARARRVVLFSSLAVYSHHRVDGCDERSPVHPTGAVYGDTKIAAEQVALQAHAAGEVEVTVVRPGDVYGPGSRPWTILPVQMMRTHQVVLPARGLGVFIPIYVDDLVDAVMRAAAHDGAVGQVFNVTGGTALATREFFGHYARMLGVAPPPTAPTPVATVIAETMGRALRAFGRPSEATAATVRMLSATGDVSIAKAREMLGWEPAVGLDEGMRRTEAWLRSEGQLPAVDPGPVPG